MSGDHAGSRELGAHIPSRRAVQSVATISEAAFVSVAIVSHI